MPDVSATMKANIRKLVHHINRKVWWHVKPDDAKSYEKRGKFLSSSFGEAEFYGRPAGIPERVRISRPLVGDNNSVERTLLGRVESSPDITVPKRLALDARLRRAALRQGYDSIALMTASGFRKFMNEGKVPRSIELNVLDLRCLTSAEHN